MDIKKSVKIDIKKGSYIVINKHSKDFVTKVKKIDKDSVITISGDKYKKDRIKAIYINRKPISNLDYVPILFIEGGENDA